MITIDERVMVHASPDTVWSIMSDPQQVMGLMPGAVLGDQHEDGSFDATLTYQLGPFSIHFNARIQLTLDDVARTGTLTASGVDGQGGTRIHTTADFVVAEEEPDRTLVTLNGQIEIEGGLAGLFGGSTGAVSARMTDQFAERLTQKAHEAEAGART